jgi:hypothetical protein
MPRIVAPVSTENGSVLFGPDKTVPEITMVT